MVKEEIVEGIRVALEKGQSLKDAMMSFFNAGYPREEINDAAREVLSMRDSSGNRIYSNEGKMDNSKNMHSQGQVPLGPGNQPNISRAPQNNFSSQFQQQTPMQFTQNPAQQQNMPITNQQNFNQFQKQNQPSFGQAYSQQQAPQNQFNQQRNFPQQQNNLQQNQFQQQNQIPIQNNPQQNQPMMNQFQNQGMQQNPFQMQNNPQQSFGMQRPQNNQNPFINQNANAPAPVAPLPPTTPQKVSDYSGEKKSSGGKGVLFFFLFLFLLLITGGIVGLVFFKDQIFNFLGI